MVSIIKAESVCKFYRKNKGFVNALTNVSLNINKSEIYGLIGMNGSGKTTLAKIIATLLIQDSGEIIINDILVRKYPEKIKRLIGLSLGEGRSFYFRLTAEQNLEFFGTMLEIPPRYLKSRIGYLLDLFDLTDAKKTPYMKFSFGMKRKLDLARAMLASPEIYILDEPTNGIDPISQDTIRNTILELKKNGKTIFLITHNLHEANQLCDRVGILDQGELLWQGSIKDFEDFKETYVLEFITKRLLQEKDAHDLSNLPVVNKIVQTEDPVNQKNRIKVFFYKRDQGMDYVLEKVAGMNIGILDVHFLTPTIEDIFREFVKGKSN
jgi:ABC-2 type transport system ATP-binding protein